MRPGRVSRLALACAVLALLPGCERVGRARQCLGLAELVNARLAAIEGELSREPRDPRAFERASAAYAELARAVRAHPTAAPGVRRAADEYAVHAERCGKAAAAVAGALGEDPPSKLAEARAELDRLARAERLVVGRLEAACR